MIFEVVSRFDTNSIAYRDLIMHGCPSSLGLNEKCLEDCKDIDCAACWLDALRDKGVIIPDAEK